MDFLSEYQPPAYSIHPTIKHAKKYYFNFFSTFRNFSTTNSILNYPFLLEPAVKVSLYHFSFVIRYSELLCRTLIESYVASKILKSKISSKIFQTSAPISAFNLSIPSLGQCHTHRCHHSNAWRVPGCHRPSSSYEPSAKIVEWFQWCIKKVPWSALCNVPIPITGNSERELD